MINSIKINRNYFYDLYGRRIQKTVNGIVTNFLWDEDNISLELNENHQPIRRYVYGVGMDNVEGHFEYAEATSNPFATDKKGWYTYIKDQVGTIYKTFSHERQVGSSTKTFDVFGNLINQSGSSKSPLGFQSKYLDPESGLYYFYHRYYSPSLGRFFTEDPLGLKDGTNMFLFAMSNPLKNTDMYGLEAQCKRISDWNITPIILSAKSKNPNCNTIKTITFDLYRFKEETNQIPLHMPGMPRGAGTAKLMFNCKYVFQSRKKISDIECHWSGEALFECCDNGKSWREYRRKEITTYEQIIEDITDEVQLPVKPIEEKTFCPCMPFITVNR